MSADRATYTMIGALFTESYDALACFNTRIVPWAGGPGRIVFCGIVADVDYYNRMRWLRPECHWRSWRKAAIRHSGSASLSKGYDWEMAVESFTRSVTIGPSVTTYTNGAVTGRKATVADGQRALQRECLK